MVKKFYSLKHSGMVKLSVAVISLGLLLPGCVSKIAYDRDISRLAAEVEKGRRQNKEELDKMATRLQGRGKALAEITNRYMKLQEEHNEAQGKLHNLSEDLNALLRDISELKLVTTHNLKGSEANEMLFLLQGMEDRILGILGTKSEASSQ